MPTEYQKVPKVLKKTLLKQDYDFAIEGLNLFSM